jgi:preprotein translocase subunit SecG
MNFTPRQLSANMISSMEMTAILPIIQIVLAVLLTGAVLLQQSEAGMGGAFGGSDAAGSWRTRRGFEKTLFIATIVLAILFVGAAVLALRIA